MSKKEIKNPILIIKGPGYSYDYFEPLLFDIEKHFNLIINTMNIKTPDNKKVTIKLSIEATNPDSISANAKRIDKENAIYEIKLTAGLSYHIWLASRFIEADFQYYSWIDKCKIIEEELKEKNIKVILADTTYYILTYYILLHEFSHIILGHCDYVQDSMNIESLNEFEDKSEILSEKEFNIRRMFEAEADRQAGELVIGFFDKSLGKDKLGNHFKFPNTEAVFEFYTYSITSIFTLLQQLTLRQKSIHPLPNERQIILINSMKKYLDKNYKESDAILMLSLVYMMDAGEKLGLIESYNYQDVIKASMGMSWIDNVIKSSGIREYKHTLEIANKS